MENLENSIREVAKKLLSEKKVDLIIGYEQGTLPLRATPCFVDKCGRRSKARLERKL